MVILRRKIKTARLDKKLGELLHEVFCKTQQELANSLEAPRAAISKRLKLARKLGTLRFAAEIAILHV